MTTEKELDTVEVLKAIQKAKEVKSKLSNPEKKVGLWEMRAMSLSGTRSWKY